MLTLASTVAGLRRPVTQQYPKAPTPVRPRFMGFPALTWDGKVDEPYCTGCMVCIRNCPTQCMSASMMDNPKHAMARAAVARSSTTLKSISIVVYCAASVWSIVIRRHCDEPRARDEHLPAQRRPRGPAGPVEIGKKYQDTTAWIPRPCSPGRKLMPPKPRRNPTRPDAPVDPWHQRN